MLSKTVLELGGQDNQLAARANAYLSKMEMLFAALFREAQDDGHVAQTYDADILARRYQSDLLGLRVSAERVGVDVSAIAKEIDESLAKLVEVSATKAS